MPSTSSDTPDNGRLYGRVLAPNNGCALTGNCVARRLKWSGAVVELVTQKRVLIVDDERLITDTLVTIFSQGGYESKGVYSAEQALLAMEDWRPALVIIDVLLPAMNGIDLAIRIKSQWPECHLSLFSGQAATGDLLDTATRNGHRFDVVAKPVHPTELLGMAVRLLQEEPGSISENN